MSWLKKGTVTILGYVLFGVFLYAGVDKAVNNVVFTASLLRTNYLPENWIIPLSYSIPAIEILAGCTGILTPYTKWALLAVAGLLGIFSAHLAWILWMSPATPCSCGGLFSSISAKSHILLNLAMLAIAILLIRREVEIPEIKS